MSTATASAARPLSGLFARAYRDILSNRTRLPSLPDVAIRLRAAMRDEKHSAHTVARVVAADPSTASYLVRVANSPIYRGVVPVNDVETGVSRLGLKTTRNLVTAHALRAMFSTRSKLLSRIMNQTWRQSARTGAFAAILAKRQSCVSPDRALLAGLLQDIGVLPLLTVLEADQRNLGDSERIERSLYDYAPRVGVVLLEHWGFDAPLVDVVRSRLDYTRDPEPEPQLADVVLIARMLAMVGDERATGVPPVQEVPAFAKLKLKEMSIEELLNLLLSGDAEVRDVMQLLGV